MIELVLASASPRRRELLALLGLPFQATSADVDEAGVSADSPESLARLLSAKKAQAVAGTLPAGVVVAGDTIVVLDGRVLGKPATPAEARRMLTDLRGRSHHVLSAITLLRRPDEAMWTELADTEVRLREYTDAEVQAYVDSGDPMDKAGAYAIQHAGFHPVESLCGCYACVVGLPLCHLYRALLSLGVEGAQMPVAGCRRFTGYPCGYYPHVLPAHHP